MLTTLWNGPPESPLVNRQNCVAINTLYTSDPITSFRAAMQAYLSGYDTLRFLPLDSVITPTMVVESGLNLFMFFGGTSGTTHVQNLVDGWTNPYDGPYSERGVSPAFGRAVQSIINRLPTGFFASFERAYLIGHSYGGAIAQALAAVIQSSSPPAIKVWSYGSPRPGTVVLSNMLSRVTNTRFFNSDDPVRFIPPHSTENPALAYLSSSQLVQGMDIQVQSPTGWEINRVGEIRRWEGVTNVLEPVGLSIASWVTDEHGIRSEYHSPQRYIDYFNVAYVNQIPARPAVSPNPPERPEVLTRRRRAENDAIAERELIADATSPTGTTVEYHVPTVPMGSAVRYKRKKFGRIWVVQYDGQTVAVGPGKRRAGMLARRWNRVLRAEQFIMDNTLP